jgi:viroplasmin and RNaseH domain-containing protein
LKIWINSLKDRKEFVSYENSNSNVYTIKVEIPQGSISSPIFFNIYKSDLNNCGKYSKLF